MDEQRGVVGVGYEGLDLPAFLERLHGLGVSLLVDVRLTPISRKRGFSKTLLSQALADAGVRYRHARELGNPKWNRPGFAGSSEDLALARKNYAALLHSADAAHRLEEVARSAAAERVALLCFEAAEERCHRHVLLSQLRSRIAAFADVA